ncbi:hypothetical protein Ae201684P_015350 [Aphanomyces euteiches]|nr:hypothetical protein Ae201684P_015350 [Aphanomyces euteiches]
MLTLFCIVVVRRDSQGQDQGKEQEHITCDAKDFQLYLALKGGFTVKDGAWLSDEDPDVEGLSKPAEGNTVLPKYVNEERKMRETKKLSNYFSGGEDYPAYCDEKIHVVVIVPEVPLLKVTALELQCQCIPVLTGKAI